MTVITVGLRLRSFLPAKQSEIFHQKCLKIYSVNLAIKILCYNIRRHWLLFKFAEYLYSHMSINLKVILPCMITIIYILMEDNYNFICILFFYSSRCPLSSARPYAIVSIRIGEFSNSFDNVERIFSKVFLVRWLVSGNFYCNWYFSNGREQNTTPLPGKCNY